MDDCNCNCGNIHPKDVTFTFIEASFDDSQPCPYERPPESFLKIGDEIITDFTVAIVEPTPDGPITHRRTKVIAGCAFDDTPPSMAEIAGE